jgi:hypothetical protein
MINESPETYTFALLSLLQDFNPDMPTAEKLRWLIKNARPNFIKQINMQQPTTIDQFLDLMRRVEHTQYLLAETYETNSISDIQIELKLDELTGKNKEVETKIDQLTSCSEQCQKQLANITTLVIEAKEQSMLQPAGPNHRETFPYHSQERVTYEGPRPLECYNCGGPHLQRWCDQIAQQLSNSITQQPRETLAIFIHS